MSARLDSPEGSYPANMTDQPTHQVDATQAEGGANEGGMEGDGGGVRPVNAGSAVATDPAVANQSAVAFESVVANNPAITTESAVATKSSTSNDDMQGISSPIQSTGGNSDVFDSTSRKDSLCMSEDSTTRGVSGFLGLKPRSMARKTTDYGPFVGSGDESDGEFESETVATRRHNQVGNRKYTNCDKRRQIEQQPRYTRMESYAPHDSDDQYQQDRSYEADGLSRSSSNWQKRGNYQGNNDIGVHPGTYHRSQGRDHRHSEYDEMESGLPEYDHYDFGSEARYSRASSARVPMGPPPRRDGRFAAKANNSYRATMEDYDDQLHDDNEMFIDDNEDEYSEHESRESRSVRETPRRHAPFSGAGNARRNPFPRGTVSQANPKLLPSRDSGFRIHKSSVNRIPAHVETSTISDATLAKRGLKRANAPTMSKRAHGANDPENVLIVNMVENDGCTWGQIADHLNEVRIATGRAPSFTANAVHNRYNRNAPLLFAAEGRPFTPIKFRGENAALQQSCWSPDLDTALVEIVKEVDSQKWIRVAALFKERTGETIDGKAAAHRFQML